MDPDDGGGGGGGAVESYGVLDFLCQIGVRNQQNLYPRIPINPLSQPQNSIPKRCHGIGNHSQLVDSSILRVHIFMI